nr:MAG TPA: hypothetical protein [Caudoviricetes sp.]
MVYILFLHKCARLSNSTGYHNGIFSADLRQ